jgi:hypothetical protein
MTVTLEPREADADVDVNAYVFTCADADVTTAVDDEDDTLCEKFEGEKCAPDEDVIGILDKASSTDS